MFADVIMEVDWSVGEILKAIKDCGIDDETCVVFTSDNGPWLNYGEHAGSAKPLREGKGTEWEGGIRVPTLMRWPGKIPAGTQCDELASTIDLLPTFAALIGAELPAHPIDGKDLRPLMFGEEVAKSPHEAFYCYYANGELQAVRDRQWKLYFPHKYRTLAGKPGGTGGVPVAYSQAETGLELYDLKSDVSETKNVIDAHPDVVARLQRHAEIAREQLGDRLQDRTGNQVREAGRLGDDDARLTW
jgi:arylsulfatase A-like enzyme